MGTVYDILVLGGGPSGLTALLYAARLGRNALLLEDNPYGCGQISLTERVDNYPGLFGINGYDLGEKFIESAVSNGGAIKKGRVTAVKKSDDGFIVSTKEGDEYFSKSIIVSLGAHHRLLNISGEEKFTGHGVSYCAVCDAPLFKGKTVAVIGGGDTALGDAITLSSFASKVYLVHRRKEFRASRVLQEKVKGISNIECVLGVVPCEISGEKSVSLLKLDNGELNVDGVFVAIGEEPNTELFEGCVKLDEYKYIITDENLETSLKGVFAAGDIRKKTLRQVITAASDGAVAAYSANDYLTSIGF